MLSHPLFGVSGNTYQWYSEHTYRTSEAALRDLWRDFEALWELYAPIAGRSAAAWEALYTIARVTWRSFHLPEAERWLRWCVERRPDLAEGWFLLGQMYQDELGEPARAEQAFKLYLQLAPRSVPPNAYLLDGWFIHSHAYEPSAVEALTRLARLSRGRARRRRLLRAAIALAPDHHLAPYVELADDLFEAGEDLHRVAALLTRAEAVFEATPWRGWPYDRPCEEMVRQEDWARANYPLRYRWHERTRTLLAERFARLGAAFWRRLGDARAAQRLLSRVLRRYPRPVAERRGPWDYWSFDPRPSYEVMLDIVLRGQRDFWQARDLCERLLALDPGNAVARAALAEMPAQP
jgi:tetratricopeptide (TPR) repeat protein